MAEAARGAGGTIPIERLRELVDRWQKFVDRAKGLKERANIDIEPWKSEFEDIVDRREDLRDRVIALVERHPNLQEKAVDLGFKAELLVEDREGWENTRPKGEGSGAGAQGEQSGSSGKPGDDDKNESGGGGGGGGAGGRDDGPPPGMAKKLLPGVKGKDFWIGRDGNDRLAIYKICMKVQGKRACSDISVRIPGDKLARYGIGQNEGRPLTREQMKKIEEFGTAEELQPYFRGEDRNPFKGLIRMIRRTYEGTEALEDDEVRSLFLAQHIFGWSDAEFQNQLRNTKWFNESTEWRKHYDLDLSDADRDALVGETKEKVFDALRELYGDGWTRHVKRENAVNAARKIASGEWGTSGNPTAGFQHWASQQEDRARRIEGTPAFLANAQEQEAQRRYVNRPEELYEDLRRQAVSMLGYAGLPDDSTLRRWATRLAYAQGDRGSEGDWAKWLRRQKQALYPFLDPDEGWMDRAAAYKRAAEEELGTVLSWEDPLLSNLTAVSDDGKPIRDQAITLFDFQQRVRQDERFDRSATATSAAATFSNAITSLFGGPGAGSFAA